MDNFLIFLPRIISSILTLSLYFPLSLQIKFIFSCIVSVCFYEIHYSEVNFSIFIIMTEILNGIILGAFLYMIFIFSDIYGSLGSNLSGISGSIITSHGYQETSLSYMYRLLIMCIFCNILLPKILLIFSTSYKICPFGESLMNFTNFKKIIKSFLLQSLILSFHILLISFCIYFSFGVLIKALPKIGIFFVLQPLNFFFMMNLLRISIEYFTSQINTFLNYII